jgi:chromosome partitioning protein
MAASALPIEAQARRKSVLVTANKGGVGKTTTCIHLATAAAKEGVRVVGVDLDPQHNFAKWAKRRESAPDYPRVPVIQGTLDDVSTPLTLASNYDLIVIDTPPGLGPNVVALQSLSKISDLVLVPTGLGIFDLELVIPYAHALRSAHGEKVSFVLNRIDSRIGNSDLVETITSLQSAGRVNNLPIPTLTDIERYMRAGVSIVDINAKRGTNHVMALWNYVKGEFDRG